MGIEEYVVPGKILYLSVCFPHEEEYHNKYFVVVGISNNPFLLKINSRKVKEHEFCLRQSIYTFLEYDSYLDCSTVWYGLITIEEIINQLTSDRTRIKGEIQEFHKSEIVRLVRLSRSISPIHKQIIIEAMM